MLTMKLCGKKETKRERERDFYYNFQFINNE